MPQAFWALHRLARCRRTIAVSSSPEGKDKVATADSGSYVSTVMRLAALLKDPRVRSEGGAAAVDRAAVGLLRDVHRLAPANPALYPPPASAAEENSPPYGADGPVADGGARQVYRLQCFADVKISVLVGGGGQERPRLRSPGTLPTVHVGDTLRVSCVLTSHLPEVVTLDGLELEMAYEGRYEGGREAENATHRRATGTPTLPGGRRSLRRLESVKTIVAADDMARPPSPAGAAPMPGKFRPPPPVVTATNALTDSLADMDGVIGPAASAAAAAADRELMAGQQISKVRSQSLSPRSNASAAKTPFGSVQGTGSGVDALAALPRHGRSRSPVRHSQGGSQTSLSPGPPLSRQPRQQQRSRAVFSARIDGPTQLLPGETQVVFSLRPTTPGIVTASRISASWGGVCLVGVLPPGDQGAGGSGAGPASVVAQPPTLEMRPPPPTPSAVIRPFRPQATLEILPPAFLPAGRGGWIRVVVTTGPDTLRGARLRLGVGLGLAWGAVALAKISLRPVEGHGGGGCGVGGGGDEETQALATAREDPAEIAVELPDEIEAGWRADVFLRVLSTAPAAPAQSDPRVSSPFAIPTPKPCTVKAEMNAWHSRDAAPGVQVTTSSSSSASGDADEVGVECRIRARAGVLARLPFETRTTVMPRPGGVVLAEASLVCRAPVALALRSCEIAELEVGATVMADPNAYLSGEILPPAQPLRLAACLHRGGGQVIPSSTVAAAGDCVGTHSRSSSDSDCSTGFPAPPALALLRLRYEIQQAVVGDGGEQKTAAAEGSHVREKEEFVFDVAIPAPPERALNAARAQLSASTAGRGSSSRSEVTLTTLVEPCDVGGASGESVVASDGSLLELKLAEPRAFEFGVDVGLGAPGGAEPGVAQLVTFQVVASPSDWMVSGLVRGSAKLGTEVRLIVLGGFSSGVFGFCFGRVRVALFRHDVCSAIGWHLLFFFDVRGCVYIHTVVFSWSAVKDNTVSVFHFLYVHYE